MERDELTHSRRSRRGRGPGWVPSLVAACCCFYLVLVVTLGVASLVPPLFGVSSTTIISGSMRPAIGVGDVVLTVPTTRKDIKDLEVGDVVTFRDPEQDRLVTHRIIEVLDDGSFRTRGDANRDPDRVPIPRENIVARPLLLLPMAGLPARWLATGAYPHAAAWAAVTVAAVGAMRAQKYRPKHKKRPSAGRRLAPAAIAAVVALGAVAVMKDQRPATAAFTGGTGVGGNSIDAGSLSKPTNLDGTPGCTLVVLLPKVTLTWDGDNDADEHVVRRSTTSGQPGTIVGTPSGESFTDTSVSAGTTYYYTVTSTVGSWSSPVSDEEAVAVPLTCA